jgi:hypothetical protein
LNNPAFCVGLADKPFGAPAGDAIRLTDKTVKKLLLRAPDVVQFAVSRFRQMPRFAWLQRDSPWLQDRGILAIVV